MLTLLLTGCGSTDSPRATSDRTATAPNTADRLLLAITTSTEDSGLLDYILPDFETRYNVTVDVIAVGTGQALALGEHGDADVVLVHARDREEAFVAAGHGTARYDVMYNDFVIVGPAADPAGIKGLSDATAAFAAIAHQGATFVSRGDDSGTHIKELAIWSAAQITPSGDWHIPAGQGMGAVLTMSDQLGAYTLSDRGTYIAQRAEGLALDILVEGDPLLINPYGVIPVNPARHPAVNNAAAQQFVAWLTSVPTGDLIASYEVSGQRLFIPASAAWLAARGDIPLPPPTGSSTVSARSQSINTLLDALIEALRLIIRLDPLVVEIVLRSLYVTVTALIIGAALGIPGGTWLALAHFRGKRLITTLIYTGMGLPPVVVGLVVYLFLSRSGPFGDLSWLFTIRAMIVAQVILATPQVMGITMSSVLGVDPALRLQLRALGATRWQTIVATLSEARLGVIVGIVAGFGAVISEVGAVMLVGGNIDGRTRVLTTAIVLETRQGNFDLALALGIILLAISFAANAIMVLGQGRRLHTP